MCNDVKCEKNVRNAQNVTDRNAVQNVESVTIVKIDCQGFANSQIHGRTIWRIYGFTDLPRYGTQFDGLTD